MADYTKLTVVNLRDELVKRGLPKTGLKAQLVQRLQDADAQSKSAGVEAGDTKAEQPQEDDGKSEAMGEVAATSSTFQADQDVQRGEGESANCNAAKTAQLPTKEDKVAASGESDGVVDDVKPELQGEVEREEPKQTEEQMSADHPQHTNILEASSNNDDTQNGAQGVTPPEVPTQTAPEPVPDQQLPTPITQNSTISILSTEELAEDSRKRKRRSQSPPPSSFETQKRLKTDNARPHVELPEDSSMRDEVSDHQAEDPDSSKVARTTDHIQATNADTEPRKTTAANVAASIANGEKTTPEHNYMVEPDISTSLKPEVPSQPESTPINTKMSPTDTRFKGLFTAPAKSSLPPSQPVYSDTEDRVVSPALHPATSALYLRELMRPLKPESVKEHLITLATPPNTPTDSSVVTEFFLDSIRTHCFVGFANISAAARVRSGLHDRIWPNERDRRPLFVDFIPEEKLKEWIDVELNTPSGRGHPQKRWEVVYEDEEGEIKAYLQEVGSHNGGLPATGASKNTAGKGVEGAPSGPRIKETDMRATQPKSETGQGFKALDDLFQSTVAKPKLYYQPVSKDKANERLSQLAAGRGGGRNDEMRRYTFEDNVLVDRAPEFGSRSRGGYGGRGGYQGSHRGRGGSFRGDDYRGRGDSRRDRHSGY